jgi:hypothetical protein
MQKTRLEGVEEVDASLGLPGEATVEILENKIRASANSMRGK